MFPRLRQIIFLITFFLFLIITESKVFSNTFNVHTFRRNSGWSYIGRVTLSPGNVQLTLTTSITPDGLKAESVFTLEVAAIPSTHWKDQLENKCLFTNYSPEQLQQKRLKQIVLDFTLTQATGYLSVANKIIPITQQTTYYFVLRDCSHTILKQGIGHRNKLQVELDVRNNLQHTSSSEQIYNWIIPLLIALQFVVLYILKRQKEEEGDNWVKLLLKISIWVAIAALLFKYLGHSIYTINGRTYDFFDIMYLLLHSASDSILMFLLTLLAFGWTVTFKSHQDFDIYIPIGSMLGFMYAVLNVLNKINDNQHDKYHMLDTIPAYIMLFLRMTAFSLFIFGTIQSIVKLKQEEAKLRSYFIQLTVLGTLYLTFVPIGFMLIEFVEATKRQELMLLGLQFARLALNIWLAVLSGWKHSSYRLLISNSFMQRNQKYF